MTLDDLPDYAKALRLLASEIADATAQPANWTNHTSPYWSDKKALALEAPEWGDEGEELLARAIWDCGKYVSTSLRHTHGVAALIDAREVFVSIWPLLRAQLELGGRVAWLLAPSTPGGDGVGPKRRCARWLLEQLASTCYQTTALKALRSTNLKTARERRTHAFEEVERFFGTTLKWTGPGSEGEWAIGPDRYMSLAAGCDLYADHLHAGTTGLYPALSGYSHPSLDFIGEILDESVDDGARRTNWRAEPNLILRQVHWSAFFAYRTATGITSYLDGDPEGLQQHLEEAMDRFVERVPQPA